jgi:hypothetical protein
MKDGMYPLSFRKMPLKHQAKPLEKRRLKLYKSLKP